MPKALGVASWMLLTLLGVVTLFGALSSAQFAYSRGEDRLGAKTLSELSGGDADIVNRVHGRRITAAAFGAAYSLLFLLVVLIPYRRGERWAWWTILAATALLAALILLRIPTLGLKLGASVGYLHLGVGALGLLLGAGRLRGPT